MYSHFDNDDFNDLTNATNEFIDCLVTADIEVEADRNRFADRLYDICDKVHDNTFQTSWVVVEPKYHLNINAAKLLMENLEPKEITKLVIMLQHPPMQKLLTLYKIDSQAIAGTFKRFVNAPTEVDAHQVSQAKKTPAKADTQGGNKEKKKAVDHKKIKTSIFKPTKHKEKSAHQAEKQKSLKK